MALVDSLPRSALSEHEPLFELIEAGMGFVPVSMLTMARNPALMAAFSGLSAAVMLGTETPAELKHLVAHMVSTVSGCRYCQAHTASHLVHGGGDPARIEAIWDFETSSQFTEAERAALRLARDAGSAPSLVDDDNHSEMRNHFTDAQIVEIVAGISMFGFLNRWNDTMATPLEQTPAAIATELLDARGGSSGKHAAPEGLE